MQQTGEIRRSEHILLHPLLTMARRYDSSTTTFSPEGRLHQVRFKRLERVTRFCSIELSLTMISYN